MLAGGANPARAAFLYDFGGLDPVSELFFYS